MTNSTGTSAIVYCNWECPWSNEQFGPWGLPLRNDGEANLHDLHNRDVDNRNTATGSIYGPTNSLDHGNMPLRHEGNLHDLYTGTWTTVCTAKGESRWSAEQLDHGDEPLRYDREVDDLENGLQLRRNRSFLHPVTRAMSLHTTGV